MYKPLHCCLLLFNYNSLQPPIFKGNTFVFFFLVNFFFFLETNTHTQGKGKEILTQRHTTTPLKSHCNF